MKKRELEVRGGIGRAAVHAQPRAERGKEEQEEKGEDGKPEVQKKDLISSQFDRALGFSPISRHAGSAKRHAPTASAENDGGAMSGIAERQKPAALHCKSRFHEEKKTEEADFSFTQAQKEKEPVVESEETTVNAARHRSFRQGGTKRKLADQEEKKAVTEEVENPVVAASKANVAGVGSCQSLRRKSMAGATVSTRVEQDKKVGCGGPAVGKKKGGGGPPISTALPEKTEVEESSTAPPESNIMPRRSERQSVKKARGVLALGDGVENEVVVASSGPATEEMEESGAGRLEGSKSSHNNSVRRSERRRSLAPGSPLAWEDYAASESKPSHALSLRRSVRRKTLTGAAAQRHLEEEDEEQRGPLALEDMKEPAQGSRGTRSARRQESKTKNFWVCCDRCQKWRLVDPKYAVKLEGDAPFECKLLENTTCRTPADG